LTKYDKILYNIPITSRSTKYNKGEFEYMGNLKRIISFFLTFALLITGFINGIKPVYAEGTTFQNEDKAKTLFEMGLFKGTDTSGFTPDLGSKLNRQQGITMIVRLLGLSDAAEALTQEQADAAIKQFADGAAIEPSLKKAVAYAIINKLVKGDGVNIMPGEPMSGKDFATLILRNLGYKDNEFKYETACLDLADKKGISPSDAANLNNKELIRDDLVSMAFSSLKAVDKHGKTVIESLIATNPKLADLAVKAGVYTKPEATPTATPSITPSATPSTTPSATTSSGGSSNTGTKPRKTPTPTPIPTPTETPMPTSTPTQTPIPSSTPTPEIPLDFDAVVIGSNKIQLAFNKAIDFNQAVVNIRKYDFETVISNTYSSEDNTKITVVMPLKVSAGKYDITVTGLDNKTITKTITAENERVDKIVFLTTKAYLNPVNYHEIKVYYRVYNQYNEDVTKRYGPTINFSLSKGTGNYSVPGEVVSNSFYEFITGEKITIAAVYADSTGNPVYVGNVFTVGIKETNESDPTADMSDLKIRFSRSYALQNTTDTSNKSIIANVHFYDKFYNDITKQSYNDSNINVVASKGSAGNIDTNGDFIITSDSGFELGESVAVSVYHKTLGLELSDVLIVREPVYLYEIAIKDVYNKDNLELNSINIQNNKFYLLVNGKNELGLTVTDYTYIKDSFIAASSNPAFINITNQLTKLTINGQEELGLEILPPLIPTDAGGSVDIYLISKYNGMLNRYTVEVKSGPLFNVVDIRQPEFTILGRKVIIPFTAYDDNGNVSESMDFLSKVILNTTAGQIYFKNNETSGRPELILDLTSPDISSATEYVLISATTPATAASPYKQRSLNLYANSPIPTYIAGLDERVAKDLFADGGSTYLPITYITVLDQFGRNLDLSKYQNPNYRLKFEISDTNVISFDNISKIGIAYLNIGLAYSKTIYAVGRGKATLHITVERNTNYYDNPIIITDYFYEFNVADRQDIVSYSFVELPVLYADSKAFFAYMAPVGNIAGVYNSFDSHSVVPAIEGLLSDGKKVKIPYRNKAGNFGGNYSFYTDNTPLVVESQNSTARLKVLNPKDVSFTDGVTDKEYIITAVVKGNGTDIDVYGKVKLSNEAPEAVSLILRQRTELISVGSPALDSVTNLSPVALNSYNKISEDTISISYEDLNIVKTSKASPTMEDLITALTNRVVKMTDQYGKPILASSSNSSSTLTSYTYYNDPTTVVNYAFKTVNVTDILDSNSNNITIDAISHGSSFKVSATTVNGLNITFKAIII